MKLFEGEKKEVINEQKMDEIGKKEKIMKN